MRVFFILLILIPCSCIAQSSDSLSRKHRYVNLEFVFSAGVGNVRIDNSILDANYERTYALRAGYGVVFPSRVGLGATAMYDYYSESGFLILAPEFRYILTKSGDFRPFVSAVAGYGFSIGDDDRTGGIVYYPSIGTSIELKNRSRLLLSAGYKRQSFTEPITVESTGLGQPAFSEEKKYSLGFFSISVGMEW